jgi:RNA polymerase sigma factor (sigma-70 family)
METAVAAPAVADLINRHGVPPLSENAPADEEGRRVLLETTFDRDRDVLLGIIETYLRRYSVTHAWQETREAALDVYTELFYEAMRALQKFDASRPPRAWLLGIAQNLVLRKKVERAKEWKRAAQNIEAKPELGDDETDAEAFDRLAAASRHYHELQSPLEKQQTLDEILSGVGEDDREIIWLSIVCGLQSEVVGQKLGINAAAARKRLQRALERLRGDFFKRFSESKTEPQS